MISLEGTVTQSNRLQWLIHTADGSDDIFSHVSVIDIEVSDIICCLFIDIQCFPQFWISVGSKIAISISGKSAHATIGTAGHTDIDPQIIIGENSLKHAQCSGILLPIFLKSPCRSYILYLAGCLKPFILFEDFHDRYCFYARSIIQNFSERRNFTFQQRFKIKLTGKTNGKILFSENALSSPLQLIDQS